MSARWSRVIRAARIGAALLLTLLGGCVAHNEAKPRTEKPPDPVRFRCQLASEAPVPNFAAMKEADGGTIYVSPEVELDNADVLEAQVLHGEKGTMLEIVLNPVAARQLYQLTGAHVGARVAVFLDEQLICALPIYGPDATGRIHVMGRFSRKEAEEFAAGLNRRLMP